MSIEERLTRPAPRADHNRLDDPDDDVRDLPEPDPIPDDTGGVIGLGTTLYERWENGYRRWNITDEVWVPDEYEYPTVTLLVSGDHRMAVPSDQLERRLCADDSRWTTRKISRVGGRGLGPNPDGSWPPEHIDVEWERSYAPIDKIVAPRRASNLELDRLQGRGSQIRANEFLEGEDGAVFPSKGEVTGWKTCFVGRGPLGDIVGLIVVGRPNARALDDGTNIQVDRLACHPTRPRNTNSWLLSKAADWCRDEGYDTMVTYAGVDNNNEGICYKGAGFELADVTEADPDGWKAQGDDRKATADGGWTRRRYELEL